MLSCAQCQKTRSGAAHTSLLEPIGEQPANMLASSGMARRFDRDKEDVLSEQDLKQLRENLSRLSPQGVRDFYDRAHEDCRLIYTRLPTPRKIQTLVQVWKQLWKWK
jgi:hypothetical protein